MIVRINNWSDDMNYTLIFLKCGDELLLLNRQKGAWMGRWNGVGGKIDTFENSLQGAIRETKEETGIYFQNLKEIGIFTWGDVGEKNLSLDKVFVFLGELEKKEIITPLQSMSHEGILDWKQIEWICHPLNLGVADNLPFIIKKGIINHDNFCVHCVYQNNQLIEIQERKIKS